MTEPRVVPAELAESRSLLDGWNRDLISLLQRRKELEERVAATKHRYGLPTIDPVRRAEVLTTVKELAIDGGVDPKLAVDMAWLVLDHSEFRIEQLRAVMKSPGRADPDALQQEQLEQQAQQAHNQQP